MFILECRGDPSPTLFLPSFQLLIPLHESIVLLLGDAHETTMLRSRHALDIDRVGEIAEILVGLADAIMLRMVAVLDVSHTPGIVAYQLEGAAALSHLVALEAHIVVIHRSPQP